MNPWIHLDTAQIPGGGELKLMQRGQDFSIMSGTIELMNSRLSGSEIALANLAWDKIKDRKAPRMLIGGLGMGFTLRAALAHLYGNSLSDRRLLLRQADVADLLRDANPAYDAILMDTDNGPDGLNRDANDSLYSVSGLATLRKAVKHGGVLAVWSAGPDQPFAGRMRRAGFAVEEVQVRASPSGKGARHIIWVGVAR